MSKQIVITKLKAECIASISGIEINPDGADVFVTGQNGAGKSTIKKAIDWVMSGSTADGEKLIPHDGSGLPFVEIELTDGEIHTKISKEIKQSKKGGKVARSVNCYLAGMPVTQTAVNKFFEHYVPISALPLLLNPFEFFKLNTDTRRELVTALFGGVTDEQVLASDESLAELDLVNYPRVKDLIRKLKKDYQDIPVRIETFESQIQNVEDTAPLKAELEEFKECKREVEMELEKWNLQNKEIVKNTDALKEVNTEIYRLRQNIDNAREKIKRYQKRLTELRTQWKNTTEQSLCPTCGQKISNGANKAVAEKIVDEGVAVKAELEEVQATLAKFEEQLAECKCKAEKLIEETSVNDDECNEKSNQLRQEQARWEFEINKREKLIATTDYQRELNEKSRREIEKLAEREKEVGEKIAACEKQIALFEKFTARKAEMISDAINSHFEHVSFEMFETAKSGEIKNTCTVTMNGVPYEFLSKGEKMKAALDVLKALQNFYEVEFPLIIDDAESYTSNSILDIPNQRIILQVAEGQELKVALAVEEGARTA